VIVTCPSCGARYNYDERRFGDNLVKRLRCTRCEAIYEVRRDQATADELLQTATRGGRGPEATTAQLEVRRQRPAELEELPELAPLLKNRRYSLAVIGGANAGQIYPIVTPRVFMGRSGDVEIQLPDSDVSRRHAMLEIHEDEAVLTDLDSTNGTFVDGVRIGKRTIAGNQEFSLGDTTLVFIVTELHPMP
jgi:predicted Zn finger-like uncharacterized protein